MKAFRLALAFVRIPRLFGSLLLFPLLISLVIVYGQLLFSGVLLSRLKTSIAEVKETIKERKQQSYIRRILLKETKSLDPIRICIWKRDAGGTERPPESSCALDLYDVALQVRDPSTFDYREYQRIFNGNFRRMHVCASCRTDLVLNFDSGQPQVTMYSIWSYGLLSFVRNSEESTRNFVKVLDESERIEKLLGKRFLKPKGFSAPISLEEGQQGIIIIINIALLIIVALWLALKAHRKVLDYFSQSGALLPLVAATGKGTFYSAIWILTLLRVACFLIASVPTLIYALSDIAGRNIFDILFNKNWVGLFVWVLTLTVGLSYATFIASIGELKHRQHLFSFAYRYLPLVICSGGTVAWLFSFLFETTLAQTLRVVLVGIPLVGILPTMIAPVLTPNYEVLAMNALLTLALFFFTVRSNVRWFAAHLEEL